MTAPLALDRDLLAFEPLLFLQIAWAGQRLVSGTGSIVGTTLLLTEYDVAPDEAGVGPGYVVSVDGVPCEILDLAFEGALTISRLRASTGDPPIPPAPVADKPVTIVTLRPQIEIVQAQVLRMLGIDPTATPAPGAVTAASITNPHALRRVVALGALHLAFAAAAALSPPDDPLRARVESYRARYAEERRRASAAIDTDGDGLPDATRRLNVLKFIRA